jgi:transposase InsO family protein
VKRCHVQHLMRELRVAGRARLRVGHDHLEQPAGGFGKGIFTATRPSKLWVADFTYVATWRRCVHGAS